MERPSPSTPLLTLVLVLLLLAPLLLARELGGSYESLHVRSSLMLPSDGYGAVVPPELDALPVPGGVGRPGPGGRVPPPPQPRPAPKPRHEPSPSDGLGSSPPGGVSGRQGLSPPPQGNPPPHYRRSGTPAAGALGAIRAFLGALFRYVFGA